jgi:hypothetical protein
MFVGETSDYLIQILCDTKLYLRGENIKIEDYLMLQLLVNSIRPNPIFRRWEY